MVAPAAVQRMSLAGPASVAATGHLGGVRGASFTGCMEKDVNADRARQAGPYWMRGHRPGRDGKLVPAFVGARRGEVMAFFVGLLLFVVIAGVLDARLGWPSPDRGGRWT